MYLCIHSFVDTGSRCYYYSNMAENEDSRIDERARISDKRIITLAVSGPSCVVSRFSVVIF